jgi:hypothetical protein
MTQAKQKENERQTLNSVFAALGMHPDNDPVEGETPDFTFVHAGITIVVEITMYRSGDSVGGGLGRRQVESEWDLLSIASTEFRKARPDIEHINVGLMFGDGPVPPRRDHVTFMEEIASFIRQYHSQLKPADLQFWPQAFSTPLMKKYLRTVYLRQDQHAVWHSSIAAGWIEDPGPKIADIVAEKSKKRFRASDELWLAIQGSSRISEMMADIGGLEDFAAFPSLGQHVFTRVFVLAYTGAFEWSLENGWRTLTGGLPPKDKPSVADLKNILKRQEWLADPEGEADRIAAAIISSKK